MKKEKNLKNKEKNKSVLNTVLTVTALVLSTLALLFSCSASATATKAQALKDIVVTEKRQANSLENDSYLYGGGFAYHVQPDLTDDVYNMGFSHIMQDYNFDNSKLYLFYNDEGFDGYTLLEIYDITDIRVDSFSYNGKFFSARYPSNEQITLNSFRFPNYPASGMTNGFYLIFENVVHFDSGLNTMLDNSATYIIKNYQPVANYLNVSNITVGFYDMALEGNFSVSISFEDKLFNVSGVLNYYDNTGAYVTYNFVYMTISYDAGLQFYGVDNTVFTPYFRTVVNGRYSYTLLNMKLDIVYDNPVRISPYLIVSTYDALIDTSIFIDSLSLYNKTYNLMDLYYYDSPHYMPADGRYITYNFNFSSGGLAYTSYTVNYTFNTFPLTYFHYYIGYNDTQVLSVRGDITLNNSGQYAGIDYVFQYKLDDKQQFTISDYYNVDIQRFQVYELQYSKLTNNIHIDNGYEGLNMSFNLIISALTAFIPFLSYEIFPGITFSILICVPLLITLLLFIFKMFKR